MRLGDGHALVGRNHWGTRPGVLWYDSQTGEPAPDPFPPERGECVAHDSSGKAESQTWVWEEGPPARWFCPGDSCPLGAVCPWCLSSAVNADGYCMACEHFHVAYDSVIPCRCTGQPTPAMEHNPRCPHHIRFHRWLQHGTLGPQPPQDRPDTNDDAKA